MQSVIYHLIFLRAVISKPKLRVNSPAFKPSTPSSVSADAPVFVPKAPGKKVLSLYFDVLKFIVLMPRYHARCLVIILSCRYVVVQCHQSATLNHQLFIRLYQ